MDPERIAPGSDLEHVNADHHGDGDRHGDGENAPGIVEQGIDDGDGQTGQGDDDDEQNHDRRNTARKSADVFFGDDGQRLTLMAIRGKEDNHVVDAAGKDGAQENPEKAGSPSVLGSQNRSDQRPRAGDGGEMMAEDDPLVGGNIILAVIAQRLMVQYSGHPA